MKKKIDWFSLIIWVGGFVVFVFLYYKLFVLGLPWYLLLFLIIPAGFYVRQMLEDICGGV